MIYRRRLTAERSPRSPKAAKDTTFLYDADGNRMVRHDPIGVTTACRGSILRCGVDQRRRGRPGRG
jgi:YD repeat-containing protein